MAFFLDKDIGNPLKTVKNNDGTTTLMVRVVGFGVVNFAQEIPSGSVDFSNRTFTLVNTPVDQASLFFYIDKQIMFQGIDYTINQNVITVTTDDPPDYGMSVYAIYTY